MPEIDHPYVRLQLPDNQWTIADAPGDLFARFSGPSGAELSLVVNEVQPPIPPKDLCNKLTLAHDGALRAGATAFEVSPTEVRNERNLLILNREHTVQYRSEHFIAVSRYAATDGPVMARGGPLVQVAVRVTAHAPGDADLAWLRWLANSVAILPALTQSTPLFPDTPPEAGATPLERFLHSIRPTTTPSGLEHAHPEAKWAHDPRTQRFIGRPASIAPFQQASAELNGDAVRSVTLTATRLGDFSVLEALDRELHDALPNCNFRSTSTPWSLANVRKTLEGRGSARMKMATPINANIPGQGRISGKAAAFKTPAGEQGYGFELRYFPESDAS